MGNKFDTRYEEIVIAALLHDLGKIAQRAGDDGCKTESMNGQLLPKTKDDRYTHQHAWYTHGAILKVFNGNANFPKSLRPEVVARVAASHHNPSSWDESIIAESDRISSGADRLEKDIEAEQKGSFIEQALLSVFSNIHIELNNSSRHTREMYYSVSPLDEQNIHPRNDAKNSRERYAKIWNGLLKDLRAISEIDFENYLAAIDAALEHWTWAIPSSTIDYPDISLYDHGRTAAAFSSVLFRYHEAYGTLHDQSAILNRTEKKFLLVMGDISGIQQYLFDLKTTKNNAKILRARSFEIRAITESAVRSILRAFNMSRFSVVSAAGGRFFMVLPNVEKAENTLDALRVSIDVEFLKRYLGSLALSISEGLPACFDDFLIKNSAFESTFKNLQQLSGTSKFRKLRKGLEKTGHVLDFYYSSIENAIRNGGKVCDMCDVRPAREQSDFCNYCESLIETGAKLPKTRYIRLLPASGHGLRLLDGETLELKENLGDVRTAGEQAGFAIVNSYEPGRGICRLPYTVPRNEDGSVKEFSEISRVAEGADYLAMFKADLDNLGSIFSRGLAEKFSISRYATLSRMLDYFFSVRVRQVIEQCYRNIYTVYSGGDDLCVIGPWQEVIDFATEIRKEFGRFVGNSPDLTISAGIALVAKGLPVARMAKEAEEQLELAKSIPGKNRVAFLGLPVEWGMFELLTEKGKDLSAWLSECRISTSLVYGLITQSKKAEEFEQGDIRKENALWKSHFLYNVRRAEAREKLPEEIINTMEGFAVDTGMMKLARIPATYALYANREPAKQKEEGR
ncbi:MAG: type III-A CRISPR-associated protein Cas10/Csm1 [Rectinema subterraneum]|uniref:type III-A CRISPR-associated protein Cas10/Csm1 n=1 Tax=Rectinema subterraneum TaxID=2653714 RepID=UPI003C7CAA13